MLEFLINLSINIWQTTVQMAPALLFGFLVAGILSVCISSDYVKRHLGGHGFLPVIKAAILGVPLPLCSCSVLPVATSLRKSGASRGAVTAFLISTPETGVDSIAATYGVLGPVMGIFRPFSAFVSALIGGIIAELFDNKEDAVEKEREVTLTASESSCCHCSCSKEETSPAVEEEPHSCCHADSETGLESGNIIVRILHYGFIRLFDTIALPLLGGLLAAGLINMLIPDNFFAALSGGGLVTMLLMMLVGLPLYVCATASVPIAAAFIMKGISPGAALVFLLTGPSTNIAALGAISQMLGKKHTIIFLLSIAGCALLAGTVLDMIYAYTGQTGISAMEHHHDEAPGIFSIVSAVVLLALMALSCVRRFKGQADSCCSGK